MAQTIHCDGGDGEPAALLVTQLDSGETHGWCLTHFCSFALELMNAMELAAANAAGIEQGTEAEGREALQGRPPRRRARPRPVAMGNQGGEGSPVESPEEGDGEAGA